MLRNQVQLITYADRLGKGSLGTLNELLSTTFQGLFSGVHILPFFDPIDGADAGFDPSDHLTVDPRLGTWEHVGSIGKSFDIMADLIVNHISADSPQFADVKAKGKDSEYWNLFLKYSDLFPEGATEEELLAIYRPRPGLSFTNYSTATGKALFWTTFTSKQIDVNVSQAERYLTAILDRFEKAGVKLIRLDAAGYAVKKKGTSCFMIPETFAFIADLTEKARKRGMQILVEIHSYYKKQIEIARQVDYVYDFALPPLVLHTLFSKNATALGRWLEISPRNCITVLDTHDGIGVIDVGPEGAEPGLLTPQEVDFLVEEIHRLSEGESRQATGAVANNLDLYQVNCTFYAALGKHDPSYLIARAIQFFCPGIPQVYYVGLLAGENDMALLKASGTGRDINREYFSREAIEQHCSKSVVQQLLELIRLRNNAPEFNGVFSHNAQGQNLKLTWTHEGSTLELSVDLGAIRAEIRRGDQNIFSIK